MINIPRKIPHKSVGMLNVNFQIYTISEKIQTITRSSNSKYLKFFYMTAIL